MILVTSEQMRELDKRTIETLRVPGIVLMEHAGREVARRALARSPKRVVVLCGKGNNGGDGWIAARWLTHWGVPHVEVVSLVQPDELQGDAAKAAAMALAAGVRFRVWAPGDPLPEADVYLDGLLGTGATRPLQGALRELVEAVNALRAWVIAIDVPTGVDASTGAVPGPAVRADETVAMACEKLGTAVTPGCLYAGRVTVADIGIPVDPSSIRAFGPVCEWTRAEDVAAWLPTREPLAHKGTFGRVGVVCGEMQGAAMLAGLGAARAGAGLIVIAHDSQQTPHAPYEFVLRAVNTASPDEVFGDCSAVVIGPGLGRHAERWMQWLRGYQGTAVIDAEALAVFADGVPPAPRPWVLTPHPKEAGRLLGWETAEVQANRVRAVRTLAERTGAVAVLKGYRSLIATPDGRIRVNPTGDASLATAGTGDVLAGVIGALLAQGLDPFDAAAAGVWLHGCAGELAGQSTSKASTMASDVVEHISRAIRRCFDTHPGDLDR